MVKIKIEQYLTQGEEVLSSCTASKRVFLCATNKRVIRYTSGGEEVEFSDISYEEITSIVLKMSKVGKGTLILGIVQSTIALMLLIVGALSEIMGIVFFLVCSTLGITCIVSYYCSAAYFELKGPHLLMDKEERKLWRIRVSRENWDALEKLAKTIRENIPHKGVATL